MRKNILTAFLLFFFSISLKCSFAFNKNDSIFPSLNYKRLNGVLFAETTIYSGLLFSLNTLWYKDYPQSKFHFFNDNSEWLQMDKFGHAFSSYYSGKSGAEVFKWCGVSNTKALLIGGNIGWLFLSSVEILDGRSKEWGFSIGDIAANSFGSVFYIGQELMFNEQRAIIKFSYSPSEYSKYRPNLLGKSFHESLIKDYNAQTYWLSFNLNDFGLKKCPTWLNFALGYGADGMVGAFNNNIPENQKVSVPVFERNRQYYLSFDLDLNKINTKNKFFKAVFKSVGFIKIPSPTLEIKGNNIKFHSLYF